MSTKTSALGVINLSLDQASVTPLYKQLLDQLRQLLISGQLASNERLPSSRNLASALDVSRTTTLNAYEQLLAEGYLVSRPGSGIFVAQAIRPLPATTPVIANPISSPSSSYVDTPCGFNAGPDAENFPFPLWARCLAKAWRNPSAELLHDQHNGGYWPLRQQISRYLKSMRGIHCQLQQIIITAGQRDSLSLLSRLLTEPGDTVLLENPGYRIQQSVIQSLGLNRQFIDIDEAGAMPPKPLAQANTSPKFALLTASRQYPLGITMNGPRRHEWLNYSADTDCWLIDDDFDSEFTYEGLAPPLLYNMDLSQRTILMGSFSKLMFQNFRLSYMVVPINLSEACIDIQAQLGSMASLHIQPALSSFLADRHFTHHMRKMSKLYRHKRDILMLLIESQLSTWLTPLIPHSGTHLVALAKQPFDDVRMADQARKTGINTQALSSHFVSDSKNLETPKQGLLMGFSGVQEQHFPELVDGLRKLFEEL